MKKISGVLIVLALVWAARPALQAQATLPDGREVLAKSVAAMGGADALKAIKSIRARGTFEMAAQNMGGSVEMLMARPAWSRLTVEISGIGTIDSGSDGKVAWTVNPMSGAQLLEGAALKDAISDSQFDGQAFGADFVKEATTLAKTTFGNRPAFKLKVVTKFDSESTMYFDADTYFPIGSEKVQDSPMGPMPTTTSLGDYKKFGALMQPTTLVQSAMGFDQTIHMTSYEYDVVPLSAFEPPPAVKALIK